MNSAALGSTKGIGIIVLTTILPSLIVGILITYFTNLIYKPDVLYTVTEFRVALPDSYEKELAKARAKVWMKNAEAAFGEMSKKNLHAEVSKDDTSIFLKPKELEFYGPNQKGKKDGVEVMGNNLDKMIEKLEKPEVLKSLLDSTVNAPTAFATIKIVNSGNREATDLELNVLPEGVVIENKIESTEPMMDMAKDVVDKETGLPVGVHFPLIKRLPPGGEITLKMFWHDFDDVKDKNYLPKINIKGSYSGGKLRYVESKPEVGTNWGIVVSFSLLITVISFGLGYFIRGSRKV